MGPNAYVIDLPYDYGISSSFNIEDLVAYKSPIVIPNTPFDELLLDPIDAPIPTPLPLNLPYAYKESIDAYVIDLPYDYGISSSFNIEDLITYKSPTVIPNTPFDEPLLDPIDAPTPLPLNLPYAHKKSNDAIVDEWIVSTRDGGGHCFLVWWQRRATRF